MIINPYREHLEIFAGTRIVQTNLGLVGWQVPDVTDPNRLWQVTSVFAPSTRRVLGGIRIKVVDQKDFVTFINQRDLEVLLGIGNPGQYCPWVGQKYVAPGDSAWIGFFANDEDLLDDLHERELVLRAGRPDFLLDAVGLERRVHIEDGIDVEEYWVFIQSETVPDMRFESLLSRWQRAERVRTIWQAL